MFIINRMATELLYPMVVLDEPPKDCAEYIEKIRPLYLAGSAAPSPMERHKYSCEIFDILEELIPESEEQLDMSYFEQMIGGTETHSAFRCSAKQFVSEGQVMAVTRGLFTALDGKEPTEGEDISEQYIRFVEEADGEFQLALAEASTEGQVQLINGSELGAAAIHNPIHIIENHPKPNKNMSKAYQNILKKYRASINTYNSRFEQLLRADREYYEDKQLFGNGISSKNMGDAKKRYW